jgi:3-methyl-2-oxobutanoate hydroxymethyltransferase
LDIPTLGIGAGVGCDGQVLVTHDLLGLFERFTPKFVKRYANLSGEMRRAFNEYKGDVKSRAFPAEEHTVEMTDDEWRCLEEKLHKPASKSQIQDPTAR